MQKLIMRSVLATLLVFGILQVQTIQAADSKADAIVKDIVKKSEELLDQAQDGKSIITMSLYDKRGTKRERKLLSYSKNYKNGDKKALVFFKSPADVRGTSFLSWSTEENGDQQWLYLPALQRVRQISSSGQGDSFMGSEFSFYDMSSHDIDERTYELLKEEAIDGALCYVIEAKPKKPEFYSRVVSWIRKDNYVPVKADFYDLKGNLLKQGSFAKIETIKNIKTPTHIEMSNVQNGRKTVLDISEIEYDTGLSDNIFTQRYMKKGR